MSARRSGRFFFLGGGFEQRNRAAETDLDRTDPVSAVVLPHTVRALQADMAIEFSNKFTNLLWAHVCSI